MATVAYFPQAEGRSAASTLMSVAVPVFLGAFLLFQVQPLLARRILPWFGGGASVWTACMLFFQLVLLGGYAYAHWAVRSLSASRLAIVHCAVLALSLAALPVIPADSWKPGPADEPVVRILLLLGATVGVPYFALSSTSPIMQAVFARRSDGQSPYRLFALSNLGSLLGLLAYPVLVEPTLGLRDQAVWWSAAYVVYAGFAAVAVIAARNSGAESVAQEASALPSPAAQVRWIALPAVASIVLLAATAFVTQDVAPTPFLWILPLAAYLVSFIVAFDAERWYRPELIRRISWVAVGLMALPLGSESVRANVPLVAALITTGVFAVSLYCHGETVRSKPGPAHLTRFYLMISGGGAVGGILVGAVSPMVLPGQVEYITALTLATVAIVFKDAPANARAARVRWLFAACLVAIVAGKVVHSSRETLVQVRNFYGSTRVMENGAKRSLVHGMIVHGFQVASNPRHPTSYYAPGSGVQMALEATRRSGQNVGLVGLGIGTLAAYGREGDNYTFYEINPQVAGLANDWFTFLKDSPAKVEIVVGDGRLALEREAPRQFDLLVVDAFSGDSIPMHLLTSGAIEVYRRHTKPDGIIAIHISNTMLDLAPVVGALASAAHLNGVLIGASADSTQHRSASMWALLTGRGTLPKGKPLPLRAGLRLWTDDYSSLLPILR